MTEYLVLFRSTSASDSYITTTHDMAEDLPKWQAWIGNIAMQGKLVYTAPVSYEAAVINNHGTINSPHKDDNSVLVAGFLICSANSLQEVQALSKNCPILKYPNSSVEIRPLVPFSTN